MKFRKKPVVIDAVRWNGANVDEVIALGLGMASFRRQNANADNETLLIETLEGAMTASRGDWIIKGVKGEFYACKPDIFVMTYEPAEET
jgi:hypothetical protein